MKPHGTRRPIRVRPACHQSGDAGFDNVTMGLITNCRACRMRAEEMRGERTSGALVREFQGVRMG